MLTPGTPIPHFETTDQDGNLVTNQSLLGQWTVLYFYPKDNTPGCTAQACSFRDANTELATRGTQVFGVSKDTAGSHSRFKTKFKLPFALLMDRDHRLAEAFDVWVEKKMFGKPYMGMERSTYIIQPDGTIAAALQNVEPEGHATQVLAALNQLQKGA